MVQPAHRDQPFGVGGQRPARRRGGEHAPRGQRLKARRFGGDVERQLGQRRLLAAALQHPDRPGDAAAAFGSGDGFAVEAFAADQQHRAIAAAAGDRAAEPAFGRLEIEQDLRRRGGRRIQPLGQQNLLGPAHRRRNGQRDGLRQPRVQRVGGRGGGHERRTRRGVGQGGVEIGPDAADLGLHPDMIAGRRRGRGRRPLHRRHRGTAERGRQDRRVASGAGADAVEEGGGEGGGGVRGLRSGARREQRRLQARGGGLVQRRAGEAGGHAHRVEQRLQQKRAVGVVGRSGGQRPVRAAQHAGIKVEPDGIAHEGEGGHRVAAEARGQRRDLEAFGGQGVGAGEGGLDLGRKVGLAVRRRGGFGQRRARAVAQGGA